MFMCLLFFLFSFSFFLFLFIFLVLFCFSCYFFICLSFFCFFFFVKENTRDRTCKDMRKNMPPTHCRTRAKTRRTHNEQTANMSELPVGGVAAQEQSMKNLTRYF